MQETCWTAMFWLFVYLETPSYLLDVHKIGTYGNNNAAHINAASAHTDTRAHKIFCHVQTRVLGVRAYHNTLLWTFLQHSSHHTGKGYSFGF